jgi:hypothetical protein
VLELVDLMKQDTSNVLIQEEEQRLNMSKREEVVPRYRSASLFIIEIVRKMKSLNK